MGPISYKILTTIPMGTYKQSILYLRTKKLKYFENYFLLLQTTNLLSESVMIKIFWNRIGLKTVELYGAYPIKYIPNIKA